VATGLKWTFLQKATSSRGFFKGADEGPKAAGAAHVAFGLGCPLKPTTRGRFLQKCHSSPASTNIAY
jgi:hypothetical protein